MAWAFAASSSARRDAHASCNSVACVAFSALVVSSISAMAWAFAASSSARRDAHASCNSVACVAFSALVVSFISDLCRDSISVTVWRVCSSRVSRRFAMRASLCSSMECCVSSSLSRRSAAAARLSVSSASSCCLCNKSVASPLLLDIAASKRFSSSWCRICSSSRCSRRAASCAANALFSLSCSICLASSSASIACLLSASLRIDCSAIALECSSIMVLRKLSNAWEWCTSWRRSSSSCSERRLSSTSRRMRSVLCSCCSEALCISLSCCALMPAIRVIYSSLRIDLSEASSSSCLRCSSTRSACRFSVSLSR